MTKVVRLATLKAKLALKFNGRRSQHRLFSQRWPLAKFNGRRSQRRLLNFAKCRRPQRRQLTIGLMLQRSSFTTTAIELN